MDASTAPGLRIAVVGSGISGLSAAWLLARRHDVTLFEQADRLGGHSNTVVVSKSADRIAVDTGFIVFNPGTYPNLVALFDHLDVATCETEMSFAVSRHHGRFEYAGTNLSSLFAQPHNLVRPGFWSMLRDLRRFYATCVTDLQRLDTRPESLGAYLARHGYGVRFRDDHLLPMAAAIWSASPDAMLDYPAAAFIRFFENHGLLKLRERPRWHTVVGGSTQYVRKLTEPLEGSIRRGARVVNVTRNARGGVLITSDGTTSRFDHIVLAVHADEALHLLNDATEHERRLLGAFRYTRNRAFLHTDTSLMPARRAVWSSWNFVERDRPFVTYWMNRLQPIASKVPLFVTLNPSPLPTAGSVMHVEDYAHPIFDDRALAAQKDLWRLQGKRHTWFCGAYFGAGFHEDGLQAGLAVAEDLGGVMRPWRIPNDSGRIFRSPVAAPTNLLALSSC
jgi:predicted NAD/FAD-binding protein